MKTFICTKCYGPSDPCILKYKQNGDLTGPNSCPFATEIVVEPDWQEKPIDK